jgi:hypothetical protein
MSKHTPGPWHVFEGRAPGSLEIFAYKTAVAECWRRADAPTEMANARLIAAAPELLKVLLEIEKFMGADFHDLPMAKQALSAIAKATGETK